MDTIFGEVKFNLPTEELVRGIILYVLLNKKTTSDVVFFLLLEENAMENGLLRSGKMPDCM